MPEEKELIFREEPDLPEEDIMIDEEPVANTGRKVKIDWFENNIWHGKTGYVIWEDPTDDSELATVTVNITDFPSEDGLKEVEQNFERRRVVDYFEDEPVEVSEEEVEIEEPTPEEQPVEESLKEDLDEETFYIVAFDNVSTNQGDNFFNKEGIQGNHDRLWHWIDKENATKYQTREEAEEDIELAKKLFAEQCEFISGEKPMFFEVGNYEEDNAVRVEVLSQNELDDFGLNESLKESKEEEHECCICHKKFKGFGNNAEPVCDGICCDECNWRVVIPTRVKEYKAGPSDIDFDDEMFEECENCREHTAIPDDDDVNFVW